jgi:inositol-phosphate phosphatase/L-galactose 1-phosphate phosphatase/histidinol-phosphatase
MAEFVRGIVRPYFRQRLAVDVKADSSPVTIADREAETAMRKMIGAAFAAHGIRGEEFGVHQAEAEWVWVLDPIDGTKSFISGSLAFGPQIALLREGVPVLGIIDQPITGERWLGQAGAVTMLNGQPVRTSDTRSVEQAIVYTSALEQFDADRHRRFAALASKAHFTRMSHDGYAAGLLALGGVDLLLESNVFDYDIMPQMPIVLGAGAWSQTGRADRSAMNAASKPC